MIEIVSTQEYSLHGLVLIDPQGAVWQTFSRPWWDLKAQVKHFLTSGTRRTVLLRKTDGTKAQVMAVKLAPRHVKIGK